MSLTIEQGKVQVEVLLRKLAEESGVAVDRVRWRERIDPPSYRLEATNGTGRIANRSFSPEHLVGFESNTRTKVISKIHSIVIRLKEPVSYSM